MIKPSLTLSLPEILPAERTPLVQALLDIIGQQHEQLRRQAQQIEQLEDEIRRLKGGPKRPQLKPSQLNQEPPAGEGEADSGTDSHSRRRGKPQRKKAWFNSK